MWPDADLLAGLLRQIDRVPDRVAVAVGARSLTYGEFGCVTADLGARLIEAGVRPGQVVLLYLRQSLHTVVGMIAALRAGAAWCVVEPGHPVRAIRALAGDVELGAIVVSSAEPVTSPAELSAVFGDYLVAPIIAIDRVTPRAVPADARARAVSPHAPAYVMATSGSTGAPKAVVVSRANLAALIAGRTYLYRDDKLVTLTAMRMTWDGALSAAAWAFTVGGTNIFPDHRQLPDADAVAGLARSWRANHLAATPSFYRLLLPHLSDLPQPVHTVALGGEPLPPSLAQRHRATLPDTTLINEYGPTEGTVTCVWHTVTVDSGPVVPIGRPVPGATAYLLGADLTPVPPGTVGELYLGGPQITLGYANRPAGTAVRFVADPFATGSPGRLYRTGDLARIGPTGEIEFHGRDDGQVKVRGVRIERHAVEAILENHPAVRQAAVLVVADAEHSATLAAFWVPGDPSVTPHVRELFAFCAERLPATAVPARFIRIDRLPLAPSGKLDEAALRALSPSRATDTGLVPLSIAQYGVWLAEEISTAIPITIAHYIDIHGEVDETAFAKAVATSAAELGSGCLRIVEVAGRPYQRVDPERSGGGGIVDFTDAADPAAAAMRWMRADYSSPVDLQQDTLVESTLLRLSETHYYWYSRMHHVAVDGYGCSNLLARIADRYNALVEGRDPKPLRAATIEQMYQAEIEYLESPRLERDRKYWADRLSDLPAPISVAGRAARPATHDLVSTEPLAAETISLLSSAAGRHRVQVASLLVAALAGFLARMTGTDDLVLTLPVTGRTTRRLRNSAGMLVNLLPLRCRMDAATSVADLIADAHREISGALTHQRYRLEGMHRAGSRQASTIVNIMLDGPAIELTKTMGAHHVLRSGVVADLHIVVTRSAADGPIEIEFRGNPRLYTLDELGIHRRRCAAFLRRFLRADPASRMWDIDLLLDGEREFVVVARSDAESAPPQPLPAYSFGVGGVHRARLQSELARMWAVVLRHDDFDYRDQFFEVGGNSHGVVALHQLIERRWPGALRVGRLFDLTTVEMQAAHLDSDGVEVEPVPLAVEL